MNHIGSSTVFARSFSILSHLHWLPSQHSIALKCHETILQYHSTKPDQINAILYNCISLVHHAISNRGLQFFCHLLALSILLFNLKNVLQAHLFTKTFYLPYCSNTAFRSNLTEAIYCVVNFSYYHTTLESLKIFILAE